MEMNLDISFNMNDNVKLKLTEKGLETYVEYWVKAGASGSADQIREGAKEEMEKNDGFMTMLMWKVMAIFGQHISVGSHQQIAGSRLYLTKYNAVLSLEG